MQKSYNPWGNHNTLLLSEGGQGRGKDKGSDYSWDSHITSSNTKFGQYA